MPMVDAAAMAAGVSIGAASAYLGSLMITRRMALVGDALGHVALPGMGLALVAGVDVSLGAFVFLAMGTLLIWKLGKETLLSTETLVGIVFVSSLALGFLIVPEPEMLESLIGDITKISPLASLASVLLSAGVVYAVQRLYRGIMLLNLSPDLAAVEGIKEGKTSLAYLLTIAVVVSLGVKVTGSLLVGAMVIVPPATARILSANLRQYGRLSLFLGATSCLAGILAAKGLHLPEGPAIILVNALFFSAALVFKKLQAGAA